MKPVYCNTAAIMNNNKTGEVFLSFSQVYNEHKTSVSDSGMTDVRMPVVSEEACVVMSRRTFFQLRQMIENIASQMEEHTDG